jgi:hypothetical protein
MAIANLVDTREADLIMEMESAIAEESALETQQGGAFKADVSNIPGAQGMVIAASDQAAWMAAWQITVERDGTEYGTPCKLPKGQLAHYLAKRRPDGGKRFTLTMPARLKKPPRYECFIEDCTKRVDERVKLIGHIETYHPYKAQIYADELLRLKQAVVRDNPKLKAVIDDMIDEPEDKFIEVPKAVLEAQEPEPDVVESNILDVVIAPKGPQLFTCGMENCTRFFDSQQGLNLHRIKEHKNKEALV